LPTDAELNYWIKDSLSLKTVQDVVEEHRKNMMKDGQLKYRAINNSYFDGLGRLPEQREWEYWGRGNETYAELVTKHVQWMSGNSAKFKKSHQL